MIAGLIAAITQALGVTLDKVVLSYRKIPLRDFIPVVFFFLCLFTLPVLFFKGSVAWQEFFAWKYILLYLGMILIAVLWNFLYYQGVRSERVQEFELILMLNPLIVIALAALFFPWERNLQILLAGFIASLALIFAHLKREHLFFSRAALGLIACVILMSIETIMHRVLLNFISPAPLYFSRTLILLFFFYFFYRPKNILNLNKISLGLIVLNGLLGSIQFIARFYGYQKGGVIITTVVLTLAPILVYLTAYLYFKEEINQRKIIAGAIILLAIIWAVLSRSG
ncbi:DMT family transporter [Patescibacteria group bacterium]|nr:DMT family transporter [Patescibacteria group bacterium]